MHHGVAKLDDDWLD